MIDLLSKKAVSGDLCMNMALHYLEHHEWGMAMQWIEKGLAKGRLSEPDRALDVLQDVRDRLGVPSAVSRVC